MNTLRLINYIASHPEYTNIVIGINDDRTPMQAIELLSSNNFDNEWAINGSLEKGTLLVYDRSPENRETWEEVIDGLNKLIQSF